MKRIPDANQHTGFGAAVQLRLLPSSQKILDAISDHSPWRAPIRLIAQTAGVCERSARSAVAQLESFGLIRREIVGGGGYGRGVCATFFAEQRVQIKPAESMQKACKKGAESMQKGCKKGASLAHAESTSGCARVVKASSSSFQSEEDSPPSLRSGGGRARENSAASRGPCSSSPSAAPSLENRILDALSVTEFSPGRMRWLTHGATRVANWLRAGYSEEVILAAAQAARIRSEANGEAPGSVGPQFVERFLAQAQREHVALQTPIKPASDVTPAAAAQSVPRGMTAESAEFMRDLNRRAQERREGGWSAFEAEMERDFGPDWGKAKSAEGVDAR